MKRTYVKALMFSAIAGVHGDVLALPDNLAVVVSNANAVGGVSPASALGCFAYDPINDRMLVAGFSGTNQQLRLINNVSGVQSLQTQIFATAWTKWTKGGDLTRTGGSPTPGGMLFNTQPIAGVGSAYSSAVIIDANGQVSQGSTPLPNVTQRAYRYNLAQDSNGDATDEMTSLLTIAQMQSIGGSTSSTTNVGRQPAWSGDGQSVYMVDTTTNYGGIWKIPAAGGTSQRILIDANDMNTEPAVISSGTIDSIYFRGGGTTANVGGIDKITHDGSTSTARAIVANAATISEFLEYGTFTIASTAMCADTAGNLYFTETSSGSTRPERRGIYRLDPQGRFSRVLSQAERVSVMGGSPNSNVLRMQPRTVSYVGGSGTFNVTQILYAESSPLSLIAGAYVFKPGDFSRDNNVDQSDVALFKPKLTPRLQAVASVDDLKFDMNGSGSVDWKDVKVLQQFYGFNDGDANIDLLVDSTDFNALAGGYGKTAIALWTEGDFTGDEKVNTLDFNILAGNFGAAPPVVPGPSLGAVVPEPASISVILLCLSFGTRRIRRV